MIRDLEDKGKGMEDKKLDLEFYFQEGTGKKVRDTIKDDVK